MAGTFTKRNWHGFTSNEKDRNEQVMAFWTVVAELIFEGKMGNYVIKLKAYNDRQQLKDKDTACILYMLSPTKVHQQVCIN